MYGWMDGWMDDLRFSTLILVILLYFLTVCTCKDALVLEARQEGQGIYITYQSLCQQFKLAPQDVRLLRACAAEIG